MTIILQIAGKKTTCYVQRIIIYNTPAGRRAILSPKKNNNNNKAGQKKTKKSIKQLWASSKMSSIFHSVWTFKPTIEQYNQLAHCAHIQPVFLNCVGQIPKGLCSLLPLPGNTTRGNISWPRLAPAEAQALSAKGQQPACNQYAKNTPTNPQWSTRADSKGHL